MIIKILPLKKKSSITRVVNYIASDKDRIADYRQEGIFHNINQIELEDIMIAFHDNYDQYAKKRSNGNRALHVILSISPLDRHRMNADIMHEVMQTYLEKAYAKALAFSAIHQSQEHWHVHAIVSSNEIMSEKSTRQSKSRLKEIHKCMIEHIRAKHPQLETSIDLKNWGKKKSENERTYYQKKRNPTQLLTKEILAQKVQELFRVSDSEKDFYLKLHRAGLSLYNYKDRVQGVILEVETKKKIRFARLGIEPKMIQELSQQNTRLKQLEKLKEKQKSRANEHERSRF